MAKIGYARVSTRDQNLDMQINALKEAGCEKIFSEKKSGIKERPELVAALEYLRPDDIFVVYKFDRIGRSLKDLLKTVTALNDRGIKIHSIKDNIDTSSASGKLMMNIFASLAEFERDLIVERTAAGRKAAMDKGKKMGRPKKAINKKAKATAILYEKGMAIDQIQEQLDIKSKSTVYRFLRMEGIEPTRKPYLNSKPVVE
jgi:DNA invertase Pin-like site-specific DNA recombinase